MQRVAFLALALFGIVALSAPEISKYEDIPSKYRDLIPDEVAKTLKDLTDDEKAAFRKIAERHLEFKDEDAALAALKDLSPSAYEKAAKFHAYIKEKVNSLQDDAKAFAKEVIAEARKLHANYIGGKKPSILELKELATKFLDKFRALPDAAKADFEAKFPILTSLVKNEKVQEMAKKFSQQ